MKRKDKRSKEFVSPRIEQREIKKVTLRDFIGGNVLSREVVIRQIPFALFLFVLLLFYISNQYRGDKVMQQIEDLEKQVKELRTESTATSFELMEKSKQSEVVKLIKARGLELEEALTAPYSIYLD